jgi:hypothetical protein
MAQKVQVVLVDDVDGGEAEESVSFSLDGTSYEIDLSKKNSKALREALAPWIGHARRVSGRGRPRSTGGRGRSSKRADLADVRSWAREAGYEVSDRGRISSDVMEAYDAAH